MRTYEEFKEALAQNVAERLGDTVEVSINTVHKPNATEEQITMRKKGSSIAPSFDLGTLYGPYKNGASVEEIAEKLVASLEDIPAGIQMPLLTKEEARENLFYQMVSAEKNRHLLAECPHRGVGNTDLVLVLRWKVGEGGSFLVKNGIAEQIGAEMEELFKMADDTLAAVEYRFKKLQEVLAEMMGMDFGESPLPDNGLHLLTNENGEFGASVIAKPGILKEIRKKIGTDFFILPSSVHELLIVPDSGENSAQELAAMVREINQTEVAPKDVLSDHVYRCGADGEVYTVL